MKQQGKQTKRSTSRKPPAGRSAPRPQDAPQAPGVGKPGEQPDTGQGAIDHHQGNHGRRSR